MKHVEEMRVKNSRVMDDVICDGGSRKKFGEKERVGVEQFHECGYRNANSLGPKVHHRN